MPLSLRESQDIDELAGVLYDMLPGSGNPRLSFPTAAQQLGLAGYWPGGSKRPAIVILLSATFERERHRFCDLIESVVRQSVSWRAGKGAPLTRDEIEDINRILARLGYKIPGLHDADFLARLERRRKEAEGRKPKDPAQLARLKAELVTISALAPTPRGFAFERFLTELFDFYDLAPRGSFRLKGEQIDGSFQDDGHTYLFEAKWQNARIARAELANPSPHGSDLFGASVAVSGTTAVVGAYADESDGGAGILNAGRAYVFDTTTGNLIATLNNPSPNANDNFGISVAVSGTIAVVGAYVDESDGGAGVDAAGRAYVFDTATGDLIAALSNPNPNMSDTFGIGVAVSGSAAVVGAYSDESDGGTGVLNAGRAYVFTTGVPGACANPARAEGTLLYNSANDLMQYCDGLNWIAIGKAPPPDPCAGSPAVGTVCGDGSVYAGLSPDGNVKMYTTPADPGQYSWNNGTGSWIDTAMTNDSYITGEAHTTLLVGLSDAASPYAAAVYCDGLSAHGKSDWYLPARDELNVLYTNRAAIGGFNTSGSYPAGYYWSSSEFSNTDAWLQSFGGGVQNTFAKMDGFSIRCVRK